MWCQVSNLLPASGASTDFGKLTTKAHMSIFLDLGEKNEEVIQAEGSALKTPPASPKLSLSQKKAV